VSVEERLRRPGGVAYLRIPAADPVATATFYRDVFGWEVDLDRERPSFRDGSAHVIGHFVTDREVAPEGGVLPYIYVDDVRATVERARDAGAEVVTEPFDEGELLLAVVRDPGGNQVGAWQQR
jgi:predicted enzyme related to lactoylglutathione lyase